MSSPHRVHEPYELEGVLDPPEPLPLAPRERHLMCLHGIHTAQPSDRSVGGDRLGRLVGAREESAQLHGSRLEHGPVPRLLFSIHHTRLTPSDCRLRHIPAAGL
jgi:hypothetical protein